MTDTLDLSYDLAVKFLSFLRVDVLSEPGDLNVLCLQGVKPDGASLRLLRGGNAPDVYDDSIIVVSRAPWVDSRDSARRLDCFRGTVDPGRYYTITDPHPQGAAHLTFGQHDYVRGEHKGHPALRGLNDINRVWRDKNGNFKPDEGEVVYVGTFGVNIHAGGLGDYVGQWSAGCINIHGGWDGAPYRTFLDRVGDHPKNVIPVTVWRGDDLFRFASAGWSMRPTLCVGIKNPWVAEAQRLLADHGYAVGVDGDWRETTDKAIRKFQGDNNLLVDGVVGPDTWKKLVGE